MTELERKALLGDQEAQKECTEKGIILPCPFCGGEAKIVINENFNYKFVCFASCTNCGVETPRYFNTKEKVIETWNKRQSLPIGRCGTCNRRHLRNGRNFCEVNGIMQDDDYCSYYEPREEKQ